MLRDFLDEHREEILARARLRVAARNAPRATEVELTRGLPLFLDQLGEALRRSSSHETLDHGEIETSAGEHGRTLFAHGVTVAQVVHDYGDLCQVITGLAVDHKTALDADEFRTLNLCLDDAIAGAVTEYSRLRERTITDAGTERLGFLAHEMRNVANTSILTFGSIQKGTVAPGGSTGVVHARSLQRLISLIDRSLADVRLDSGVQNVERIAVREILEEVEIGAAMVARERGLRFEVVRKSEDPLYPRRAGRSSRAAAIDPTPEEQHESPSPRPNHVADRNQLLKRRPRLRCRADDPSVPAPPSRKGRPNEFLAPGLQACIQGLRSKS